MNLHPIWKDVLSADFLIPQIAFYALTCIDPVSNLVELIRLAGTSTG
jgi:hypothetical protein